MENKWGVFISEYQRPGRASCMLLETCYNLVICTFHFVRGIWCDNVNNFILLHLLSQNQDYMVWCTNRTYITKQQCDNICFCVLCCNAPVDVRLLNQLWKHFNQSYPRPQHATAMETRFSDAALCPIVTERPKHRLNSLARCQIPFVNDSSDESVYFCWIPQHVSQERPGGEQWRE